MSALSNRDLATGDLDPQAYHQAVANVNGDLSRLEVLTAEEPLRRAQIRATRGPVAEKLAELVETIRLRRVGGP